MILLFFLFLSSVFAADRIWFIRHCDKPTNGPCCSHKGIKRSMNWHHFFSSYINSNLTIYTSGTSSLKTCQQDPSGLQIIKHCPKSHRMLITASLINKHFNSTIKSEYCVGHINHLLKDITNDPVSDALVIWQHDELKEMIEILIEKKLDMDMFSYENIVLVEMFTGKHFHYNYNLEIENETDGKLYIMFDLISVVLLIGILGLLLKYTIIMIRRRQYEIIRV